MKIRIVEQEAFPKEYMKVLFARMGKPVIMTDVICEAAKKYPGFDLDKCLEKYEMHLYTVIMCLDSLRIFTRESDNEKLRLLTRYNLTRLMNYYYEQYKHREN